MSKVTNAYLRKLEGILQDLGYAIRYEKGHFRSGYCLVENRKMVIINKYFDVRGRTESLTEIVQNLEIDFDNLSINSIKTYERFLHSVKKSQALEI